MSTTPVWRRVGPADVDRPRLARQQVEPAVRRLGPPGDLDRPVVIEDEPSEAQLEDNGLDLDDSMYGLYEGVPRTDYAADWAASPNRITLFRVPLVEVFADPAELETEVRMTVLHELAHHLGIDDHRLDELGAG